MAFDGNEIEPRGPTVSDPHTRAAKCFKDVKTAEGPEASNQKGVDKQGREQRV